MVTGRAWSPKQNLIIIAAVVGLLFLRPILDAVESSLANSTYDYAVAAMNSDSGSSIIRPVIAAVPVVIAYIHRDRIDAGNKMIHICINMSLINFLLNLLATFTCGLYVIRLATYTAGYSLILYPIPSECDGQQSETGAALKVGFYILYFIFYCYQMSHQGSWGYNSDILGVFS